MRSFSDALASASGGPTRFVLVGQRRSRRAIEMGVRWEHGRLCARTLHAARSAAGLDHGQQTYLIVWSMVDPYVSTRGAGLSAVVGS